MVDEGVWMVGKKLSVMNTGKYHEITVAFGNGPISFQVLPVFIPTRVLPDFPEILELCKN